MMVTFISQCQKKALNRTRRVLDAFANRIGDNTWQTIITEDGLIAVKTLLRKTATKNTAVSCHWIRSRSRSELVWIVGNRKRFNAEGIVPVNSTRKNLANSHWENDWMYLPLIKCLSALAALFHDWGKASEYFQTKLKEDIKTGDPLRHEWISLLFFNAYVNGETDEQWLNRLITAEFDVTTLKQIMVKKTKTPLYELPNAASMLAWLIVSHHRLPTIEKTASKPAEDFRGVFRRIRQDWGYENSYDPDTFNRNLPRCFDYQKGLPSDSPSWLKECKKQATRLQQHLPLLEQAINDGSWRLIILQSRLALMLGDHFYSSLKIDDPNRLKNRELALYANTESDGNKKRVLKQTLDEHLLGVAKQAGHSAHFLPMLEANNEELERVRDVKLLKQNSKQGFEWQDKAVKEISQWRQQNSQLNPNQYGFFAVNMASTGKGKTFANAKIMRALSPDADSLRYVLALGLRTLTLQTGDEYRERIGLRNNELAVLIGSRAVLELHDQKAHEKNDAEREATGSESEEILLDNELYFECDFPDDWLKTALKTAKDRQFLYAPVLSCTIDHLMAATETQRGGRYILPTLRLMSSDLVIDEIDDFDGKDLIAIGRLIHLAGMLGRKVMISSATIPPDLAEGYYYAYQSGWSIFAAMRQQNKNVGCAWIDEFSTQVTTLESQKEAQEMVAYQTAHQKFINKRNQHLLKQAAKRKATIFDCSPEQASEQNLTIEDYFAQVIQAAIIEKHQEHHLVDTATGKHVSFGVVRVANIKPCIALTRNLLNAKWPEDIEIRAMAYHSQQVLIMRNEQEKHLDSVLKRTATNTEHTLNNPQIRAHLKAIDAPNVIFILVATPVEEVGRDHDFDWAVVEPSSYRSFIQLAGRIMRHRELTSELAASNMALLQFNLKGLNGKDVVFNRPGYESNENRLVTHDLNQLLDIEAMATRLDATARITKAETLQPKNSLVDLEHHCIQQLLTNYSQQGPETLSGWITSCWWLTGEPQHYVQFRKSTPELTLFLIPTDRGWIFAEKDSKSEWIYKEYGYIFHDEELKALEKQRLWLWRDYQKLLENSPKSDLQEAAQAYGEANFPIYEKKLDELKFSYSSQFGLQET